MLVMVEESFILGVFFWMFLELWEKSSHEFLNVLLFIIHFIKFPRSIFQEFDPLILWFHSHRTMSSPPGWNSTDGRLPCSLQTSHRNTHSAPNPSSHFHASSRYETRLPPRSQSPRQIRSKWHACQEYSSTASLPSSLSPLSDSLSLYTATLPSYHTYVWRTRTQPAW